MNTLKSILVIISITIFLSSCASLKKNQAATTDPSQAIAAINQIKKSGIVVIFPTDYKKEKALIKMAKTNPSLLEDLELLRSKRKERLLIWQNTKKEYSFNKMSIVPDSLLKSYIANPTLGEVISENGSLEQSTLGNIYVLYTDYGGFEVKKNGHFLPNPFPNKVQPAWGSSMKELLGVQSQEKSVTRFFTELGRQLNSFYIQTQVEGENGFFSGQSQIEGN